MKKIILVVFSLSIFLSTQFVLAAKSPSYLCTSEQVGGPGYEMKKQHNRFFNPGDKYSFRKLTLAEKASSKTEKPYGVLIFGTGSIVNFCDTIEGPIVICHGENGDFKFNSKSNRFMKSFTDGYVEGDAARFFEIGMVLIIGHCSKN